ncbi:MAG: alpha/beta fold hydrolase [Planctomycetota bacterium]
MILLVHGLGDHGGRFRPFAERMCRRGWAIAAADLPGHGLTPGRRGIAKSYDSILRLLSLIRQEIDQRIPDTPHHVLGHSMGANFAASFALRREEFDPSWMKPLAGLLLIAPMVMPPEFFDRQRVFAAWGTGHLLRWLRIKKPARAEQLIRDSELAARLQSDPLLRQHISLYLATQLVAQGRFLLDQAGRIASPTMLIYGDEDELIDQKACRNLSIRIGRHADLVTWPGGRHDLLNDADAEMVADQISRWIGSHSDAVTRPNTAVRLAA